MTTRVSVRLVADAAGEVPLSRRVAALQHALRRGEHGALEAFWREVAERGTPLIEPIAGDDEHALVTFVWRASEELGSVVVGSPLVPPRGRGILLDLAHLSNTDLWYTSIPADVTARTYYYFWPIPIHLAGRAYSLDDELRERVHDPLNSRTLVYPRHRPDRTDLVLSVIELPEAPPDRWTQPRKDVRAGNLADYRFASQLLDNERTVWVYTPPGYAAGGHHYAALFFFDGGTYVLTVPTPIILDNLLSEAAIPPLVAVFVGNADRRRELGGDPRF